MKKRLLKLIFGSFIAILPFDIQSNETPKIVIEKSEFDLEKFNSYPESLKQAISAIEKIPEITAILREVQKDGPITVKFEDLNSFDFEALWNSQSRTIVVNASKDRSLGNIITSIVFELHNAKSNHNLRNLFEKALKGKINKDTYVRNVEKMEHQNALETSKLMNLGISKGVFPEEARWNMYEDFEDHYKLQQIYNHSQWLAARYDEMTPIKRKQEFKGSINGLSKMSQKEKDTLAYFLSLKNQLNTTDFYTREKATLIIKKELEKIKFCDSNSNLKQCSNNKKQKQLFESIFEKMQFS